MRILQTALNLQLLHLKFAFCAVFSYMYIFSDA